MVNKIKKILSSFLIFLILFNISFQLTLEPFLRDTNAGNAQYSDLVTIFVEDLVWNPANPVSQFKLRKAINQYAKDISNNLENTATVIVPVPQDATPFKIASINEKFFFEGEGGEKNLVGSVFIGDIPIPVVHDNDDFSRTIFPYVDFRNKAYVYSHISEKYEKNDKRLGEVKAEIWHGFISPNSTTKTKLDSIIEYFDKNHAYYMGEAPFEVANGLTSGKKDDELDPEYEPRVFYFDQARESDAMSYSKYKGYLGYQNNKEDISYNRFTKTFAEYMQEQVLGKEQQDVQALLQDVAGDGTGLGADAAGDLLGKIAGMDPVESTGLSNPNIGDIQARNTILNLSNKFVETFSPGMTGEMRTNVHNSGRYSNTGSSVEMDSIPFLVSHLDSITDALIKSVNTKLEGEIDSLVMTGGLSRNIAVPTKIAQVTQDATFGYLIPDSISRRQDDFQDVTLGCFGNIGFSYNEFTNFLDGTKGNYITSASDCSSYYGSSTEGSQLVDANRGLNTNHIANKTSGNGSGPTDATKSGNPTADITEFLEIQGINVDEGDSYKGGHDGLAEMVPASNIIETAGYFGGNTPLFLNIDAENSDGIVGSDINDRILTLKDGYDKGSSIVSVRDITGAALVLDSEPTIDTDLEFPNYENGFNAELGDATPSPLRCLNNNYILTRSKGWLTDETGLSGGIEYPDEIGLYEPNFYFWDNESDRPFSEVEGTDLGAISPDLAGAKIYAFQKGTQNQTCPFNYSVPVDKPLIERTQILGFSGAFLQNNLSDEESIGTFPITANFGLPSTRWREDNHNGPGNSYQSATSGTQNWSKESRNIKFDFNPNFDYIYKQIHANAGDECSHSSAYLFGNEEIFKSESQKELFHTANESIPEEERGAAHRMNIFLEGIGIDVWRDATPVLATVENTNRTDTGLLFKKTQDRAFEGEYLTGGYLDNLGLTGSLVVPRTLEEERVVGELVKTSMKYSTQDKYPVTFDGSQEKMELMNGLPNAHDPALNLYECYGEADIVNYFYKEIPSYVEHKSPNSYELYSQIQHKVTPNLPIDRDRYIDFIGANSSYQKILYPYLFRLELPEIETVSGALAEKLEIVSEKVKEKLDEKSAEINQVIADSDPSSLTDPIDIEIYEHLKVANFENIEDVDLYQYLKDIDTVEIADFLDTKEVNFYDFLVFSIYWNNLKSVPAKYRFVMEQYLSDQYQRPELEFLLPKNKKMYEIAYLGAPGTAKEMYVSLDPEAKGDNPYSDIVYDNVELGTQLFSSNVYTDTGEGADFKCSPPEGVPLWEWPGALKCWLDDFENPRISFAANSCSQKSLFLTEDEQEAMLQCGGDFNQNGIEECVEYAVPDGDLQIYSNSPVYYYNTTGKITVVLQDASGNPIKVDSTSRINLDLVRIEPRDGGEVLNERDYVSYKFDETRNSFGEANFFFTGRGRDAILYFKAKLELKDSKGVVFATRESDEIAVEISGDRLFATSYKLDEDNSDIGFQIGQDTVVASDSVNIFVADELNFPVAGQEDTFSGLSEAKNKMVMSLANYDDAGENVALNYPINIKIYKGIDELQDDVDQVFSELQITGGSYNPLISVNESGFYRFVFTDANGINYSRVIHIIPDTVASMQLNLSTNISETRDVHTPHIFTLYDQYNNIADSEFYTVKGTISGDGVTFDDKSKSKVFTTYEGFQAFKLISEDTLGESTIKFEIEGVSTQENFYVVEDIAMNVEPQFDELIVGGGIYTYKVSIEGAGASVQNLNTRLYVSANDVYLESLSPFFEIENGVSEVSVVTKKASGIDIPIEFQAYGLRDTFRENQTIMHEVPIKIDISLDRDKIEASPESSANLLVELKDRFGNIAFSDSSTEVVLELQDKISRYFTPEDIDSGSREDLGGGDASVIISPDALKKTFKEGKTTFKLSGTEEPGLSYFKVLVPSVAENSFEVNGQAPFSITDLDIPGFTNNTGLTPLGLGYFDDLGNGQVRSQFMSLIDLQGSSDFGTLAPTLANRLTTNFAENNKMIIRGVGENAGMIETYYFWQANKIQDKHYNALYTTMVGSNYGDINEPDYLAGGILFDKNNRGLAVTSLLQNPYKSDGVFKIGKQGSVRKVASNEDLAQDIVPTLLANDDVTKILLNNNAINVNVGDVYYNFDAQNTELNICEIGQDISECSDLSDNTEIIMREISTLYNVLKKDDSIIVLDASGEEILSVDKKGIIQKDIGIQSIVDFDSREKFLKIDFNSAAGEVATLLFNFNEEAQLHTTRDSTKLAGLNSIGNSIIFHIKTNLYEAKALGDTGIQVSYRDLFNSTRALENFVEDTPFGYEKYDDDGGIGWKGGNKTLLSFASGKSVGEATKDYHSFYMINLGDPVVSLKKIAKNLPFSEEKRNFDSTIGEIITREDGIVDYSIFDYNNDGRDDIMIHKNTGYIQLLENTSGATKFMDRGNLLYIADISSSSDVKAGDFNGDGYGDIFLINTKGQPAVFMNDIKKFTRYNLEDQFALNGKITQAEVFDMDANGSLDVVILDESGQINIMYGGGSATDPRFTKETIEEGAGATLLEEVRNDGAAVYYDGLPQSDGENQIEALSQSSAELLEQENTAREENQEEAVIDYAYFCSVYPECKQTVQNAAQNFRILDPATTCRNDATGCFQFAIDETLAEVINLGEQGEFISEGAIEGEVFIDLPYRSSELLSEDTDELSLTEISGIVTENIPEFSEPTHPDIQAGIDLTQAEISQYITSADPEYLGYEGELNYTTDSTFIKSEYSELAGIRVRKSYSDNDGGYLKSGDNVEALIVLTNISDEEKTNIAFTDAIPEGFILDKQQDIFVSVEGIDMKNGIGNFDYMFEGFSLPPGEEIRFAFGLIAPSIRVGYMEVAVFEDAGGGNDGLGDVKMKASKDSCGSPETMYMSPGYEKISQEPTCDDTNMSEELEQHLTDDDNNGVPDYIDQLLVDGDAQQSYANDQLSLLDLDSDLDGLPDREDDSPNQSSSNSSFVDDLAALDAKADEASAQIDTIIEGLGCGFGGGGCIASPLNWAPLAPGNDPTLFGMPVGDGLHIDEGIPIFSAMTYGPVPFAGCQPFFVHVGFPTPWSMGPGCGSFGAGGYFGTNNRLNFIRIFVTPTLTGAAGIAICFGPAREAGYANPPGVHPLVPGGNCIVAAVPLDMCSNDGSDGDPSYIGAPTAIAGSDFSIIGGNCEFSNPVTRELNPALVSAYLASVGDSGTSFSDSLREAFAGGRAPAGETWQQTNDSALIQGGVGESGMNVEFSLNSDDGFAFQDVQKIKMKKINPFPDFFAGWVDRQVGEISDKLTTFPGIFIILPDMSGFMQLSWTNFTTGLKESFDEGKKDFSIDQGEVNDDISKFEKQKKEVYKCGTPEEKTMRCYMADVRIAKLKRDNGLIGGVIPAAKPVEQKGRGYMSGIKTAFTFLSSLPLLSVQSEKVIVTIPWADGATFARARIDRLQTEKQWKQAYANAGAEFSNLNENFDRDFSKLISSHKRNLEILEHYADFPQELNKLLRTKELRLEQIMCNLDAINEMLNGRIDRNGKRFKAWIELFITVKAILKSWQLLVDIFYEYDAACHECKNERQDLYFFAFKLISVVIPKMPVIQFPRWPDVVIDLHNIRAGIVINIPDIELRPRPIVLPPLPNLNLPSVPRAGIRLPSLPLLEDYSLPELPELPSLPVVDLPDLPPPPKLPKMFAQLEGMLKILKLVTKVMCILKSSPFVPEWRAGDQIAFITERSGYLPTDFLDVSAPQFTYPFVDAIKVSTYVNFEYETDFLIEATRSALLPMNTFTSDVSKKINRTIPDFNFESLLPEEINGTMDSSGEIEFQSFYDNKGFIRFMGAMTYGIQSLVGYMGEHSSQEVNANYFTRLANENLNKKWIVKNPQYNELRKLWQGVQEYDYMEEDVFIEKLKEQNSEKFETLDAIIKNEIDISKKQRGDYNNARQSKLTFASPYTLVSDYSDRFTAYSTQLEKYNASTQSSFVSMMTGGNEQEQELKAIAQKVTDAVSDGIGEHEQILSAVDARKLFAIVDDSGTPLGTPAASQGGTCQSSHADRVEYKGIYILENKTPYRLFDYLDEVEGDETYKNIDFDLDGDQDILYMMEGILYLKENLETKADHIYVSDVNNTSFNQMDEKYEAVNGFREVVENNYVNITFNAHSNRDINAYRLEFYDRIDAFDVEETINPPEYQKVIIDGFSRIEDITLQSENDFYTVRDNIGKVNNISIAPGLQVETDEVIDIRELIVRNNIVQITPNTKMYSGRQRGKFYYYYRSDDTKELKDYTLDPHQNIEFEDSIVIVRIEPGTTIYTKTKLKRIYESSDIPDLTRLPFLEGTIVRVDPDAREARNGSNMQIEYYDGTVLRLDFRLLKKYELVDLGPEQEEYYIKTYMENSFYYAKFYPFLEGEFGTQVRTVLMSPQNEIDSTPPDLDYGTFRIPVYKERVFDLTPHIYEDSGIRGIKEMYLDTDLTIDSDGNGDPADDRVTSAEGITLERTLTSVKIRFDAYDTIFTKDFKVIMIDGNDNTGEAIVGMEVYAPIPDITHGDVSQVRGLLRENIDGEPITLFRYRGGVLSKLRDISGAETIDTGLNGAFKFNFPVEDNRVIEAALDGGDIDGSPDSDSEGETSDESGDGDGNNGGADAGGEGGNDLGENAGGDGDQEGESENTLTIEDEEDDSVIAVINGETGTIDLQSPTAIIKVLASSDPLNDEEEVKFIIEDDGVEVYSQILVIPNGYNQVVDDFENIGVEGMYIDVGDEDLYDSYLIPENAPALGGTLLIFYKTEPDIPLFIITKDGKINTKDENYTLEYGEEGDHIVITLIDGVLGNDVAEVLIKTGEDFTLR